MNNSTGSKLLASGVFLGLLILIIPSVAISLTSPMDNLLKEDNPVAQAAEKVLPAVVNIQAKKVVKISNPMQQFHRRFDNDFFRDFFRQPFPEEHETESRGSGFVFNAEGWILTNNHVVSGADKVTVTFIDGRKYDAEVKGRDPKTDLAVLKIEVDNKLPTALLGDSEKIKVGNWCIAIGNPFYNLEGTVTFGVVSAKGRNQLNLGTASPSIQDYIQTDASINPGNSGGPLIDINGKVIGINSAIASPSGGNVGIGFAIPINLVKEVLDDLVKFGEVRRAFLGVTIQELTPLLAEAKKLENVEGILVNSVLEDGPAEKGGIKAGDVIVEFDGRPITTVAKLQRIVGASEIDKKVKVKVIRDGKAKTFRITLGKMDEDAVLASTRGENETPWLGIEVADTDTDEADRLGMKGEKGVVVTAVEAFSPAAEAGIRPGMIIKEIEQRKIINVKTFIEMSEKLNNAAKPLIFLVGDKSRTWYIAVEPR